jgi:hypothetical protein
VIEEVRHSLAFAIRVDDAFTDRPVGEELDVSIDTGETPVAAPGGGRRQADGTYRFIDLAPGPRQVAVASPSGVGFTWTATTSVAVPIADRRAAIVIPMFPTTSASAPTNVIAIRGVLVTAGAGQEVQINPVLNPPPTPPPPLPPPRFTRCDADGEFLFVVAGGTQIDPPSGLVPLKVDVPGRGVTSVEVFEGLTATIYPTHTFFVPPGRELRVRIHLS